jgi:4-amino-4-deoxy-L-arabinose transferase-like glycosyltransferase
MIAPNSLRWLRGRIPECALLILGLYLRMTMRWRYVPEWGFDSQGHFEYIDWIVEHHAVPPVDAFFHAFHPPLFYAAAAALAGHTRTTAVWIPIILGTLRLGILWAGLEITLRNRRWARLSALALATVLPASVHLDGLVYGEGMSGFLIASAMLVTLFAFRRQGRSRWWLTTALGIILGLAFLTKISGVVILFGIGIAAILEFVASSHVPWRTRWQNLLPWSATLVVCFAVCGWYFVPITRTYGRPFVTSFDIHQTGAIAPFADTPSLDRRTLGFVFGWDRKMYDMPYTPAAAGAHPRFFPLLMLSTFIDYYNYSFSGLNPGAKLELSSNDRPLTRRLVNVSRHSVMGGTLITFATSVAFAACLLRGLRGHRWDIVALLLGAGLALLSALYFAILYPTDVNGVIKGNYVQFGAPPLYAMFGVAVDWAKRKPSRWVLLCGLLASLWFVAAYTLYCRARLWLPPGPWM